ncbi:MAG TPA: hypothetical protein VMX12_06725 [Acidimicrobiia bacterium]|nr:hypothetical protein [Acidimicrobiia bacterium]
MGNKKQSAFQKAREKLRQAATPKTILVGIGMYRYPEPKTIQKVWMMCADFLARGSGYNVQMAIIAQSQTIDMRNQVARSAMNHEEVSHVLFIDDDMDFPVGAAYNHKGEPVQGFNPLVRLLERNKDMVGALCTARDESAMPFIGWEDERGTCTAKIDPYKHMLGGDPFQVDFIGFGMVLIKREVLVGVLEGCRYNQGQVFDYYNTWRTSPEARAEFAEALKRYETHHDQDRLAREVESIQAACERLGEDYAFCKRARDYAGATIWCDPSFDVDHIGRYGYGRKDWLGAYIQREGPLKTPEELEQEANAPQPAAAASE